MKTTYVTALIAGRTFILQVEPQPDETDKITRVLFDSKMGNKSYRQYNVGDFHRFPKGLHRDPTLLIRLVFTKLFQRFMK